MLGGPPEGRVVQTYEQFDWLLAAVQELRMESKANMASLSDLKAQALETRQRVDQLVAAEGQQTAAIHGLGQSVDMLVTLVQELKAGLSAEEQAIVDETMADVASVLTNVSNTLSNSASQSTEIGDIAARADAAGSGSTQ